MSRLWFAVCRTVCALSFALAPLAAAGAVDFQTTVYPIFQQRCLDCHGPSQQEGNLRLDRQEFAAQGGHTGSPILGGTDVTNAILLRVTTNDPAIRMPKGEPPLSAAEIETIREWVQAGTPWTDPPAAANDARSAARRSPRRVGYAITWENVQPWNPNDWPNERFAEFSWWFWRFGILWLVVLVFIGLCERARLWVAQGRSWATPPRGRILRGMAAIPRSWFAVVLLLMVVAAGSVFYQRNARLADEEVLSLQHRIGELETRLNPPTVDEQGVAKPVHPRHPPRLGGEYYRGNDERNSALFNGGFYRTAVMRVWLCRADDTILHWGDELSNPAECHVRFEIEQAPGATDTLFADEIWQNTFVSALPRGAIVTDPDREVVKFTPDGPHRWVARYPLDLSPAQTDRMRGLISISRGEGIAGGHLTADPHYAAEYDLRLADGRITRDSQLWMGYVFRTGNVQTVPEGKIPEDEWFSFRPIPEIEAGQQSTDQKLLGVDAYRDELKGDGPQTDRPQPARAEQDSPAPDESLPQPPASGAPGPEAPAPSAPPP